MEMRKIINLISESLAAEKLADVIRDWSQGYSTDDAFEPIDPEYVKKEDVILRLATVPPTFSGALYRGTGIADDEFERLKAGETIQIVSSPGRRLVSWTKDEAVARNFAEDANEFKGFSSIVVAIPASKLKMIADVDDTLGEQYEGEIIVLNEPLTISPKNVVASFKYEGDE